MTNKMQLVEEANQKTARIENFSVQTCKILTNFRIAKDQCKCRVRTEYVSTDHCVSEQCPHTRNPAQISDCQNVHNLKQMIT